MAGSVLSQVGGFFARAASVARRKHFRAVGLLNPNGWGDVPAIVRGLLARGDTLQGACIAELESEFARRLGGGHAISFGSGRVAFAAILDAMEIAQGDEVIMPGYTCVVVPNPVLYRDARPIYVDIDRRSLNLDPADVKRKVTPRTRAIIVQHTFGLPAEFNAIAEMARPAGIRLIEDCTHALGARYFGQPIGTLGEASFFSMEQSKLISTGMGGMAFTRDAKLAGKLVAFRQRQCEWPRVEDVRRTLSFLLYQALLRGPRSAMFGDLFGYYLERMNLIETPRYSDAELECRRPPDFLKRLPNALARVALAQLARLERNLACRDAAAQVYRRHLPEHGFTTLPVPEGSEPVCLRFPLWVDDKPGVSEFLRAQEIEIGSWFNSTIHPRGVSYEHAQYREGSCPNAEAAVQHVVNLPSHPRMSRKDAMRVVNALAAWRHQRQAAPSELHRA